MMVSSSVMAKAMGIDYGTKRVGIALSDEGRGFAFPKCVLDSSEKAQLITEVATLIADENVDLVVIGESVDYDGIENSVMEEARAFAEALAKQAKIDIVFENEILTSVQARRQFESKEKTRKQKNTDPVDASAAALILQSYLDKNYE